jgi:hypothetical protein
LYGFVYFENSVQDFAINKQQNSTDDLNDIVLHGFTFRASSTMHMYTWHDNLGPKSEAKR